MKRILPLVLPALWIALAATPAVGGSLHDARVLWLRGNYEEAAEEYAQLVKQEPVAAAIGLARCHASRGKYDNARTTLEAAAKEHPKSAELQGELARLAFDRGDYQEARKGVDAALKLDAKSLAARWIDAELLRATGKLAEAGEAYKWFVDYYNAEDVDDAQSLHLVGLGAAQFARWNRLSSQFSFLVNELYPDALAAEKQYWPANYEAGLLFLEKYNQRDATGEFKAALKLNPNAAEVHAALARLALQNFDLDDAKRHFERALEINPNLLAAHQAKADLLLANFQTEAAAKLLEESLKLNPVDEETLGRLGAAYVALDGLASDPAQKAASRFGKLEAAAIARNPHCGTFYLRMAATLADRRKFNEAEVFFEQALARMPQLVNVRGEMGLMYMRLGEEVKAEQLLKESFQIDPFNVRVKNQLEVLDVLSGYAVLETEHFVIKFDRGKDEVLARYAARYLEEEVYPVLCKQFGFEPKGKSLFEIFSRAKNTRGHGWFSARMVGLPYIGTVGACAGKMVAMTSPNDMDQKFNWARVLKHEFVHVLNLQQTNFNIPHWYTEALAVLNENYPRPEVWNQLLAARVPKGEIFNLDDINLGFIRPKSSLDWQMAYCQAELYAQYMLEKYGDDALARMLDAYSSNLSTPAALKRCFDVEQADFERGYREYLNKVVQELSPGKQPEKEMTLAELVRAQAADPENPDLMARLAQAHFARKSYPDARELARKALKIKTRHQGATYVIARLHLLVGDEDEAIAVLEECLDRENPDENVLTLLASLKLKAEKLEEAAKLNELGARRDPANSKWTKALARVYLTSGDEERLAETLAQLAELDADDFTFRKKLAQLALEKKQYAEAARWATQAMQIDVMDVDVHQMLAEALVGQELPARAIVEYETAVQLSPKDKDLWLALAKTCIAAKEAQKATLALEALLKLDPEHEEAKKLLAELK